MSYFYGKICISSRHCYPSYNFFHISNHTDSCQPAPFLNNLLVMKMVTVSDLCLTYVILFILIYVLGPLVCRQPLMTHA